MSDSERNVSPRSRSLSEAPASMGAKSSASKSAAPRSRAKASGGEPAALPKQPQPFPFQARAIKKAIAHLSKGANTVIVGPTGCGKTVMAGHVIKNVQGRVMGICNTNALLEQMEERLCPTFTIQGILAGAGPDWKPDVIVWDECHHSEGDEWRHLRQLYPKALLLGLTATPQRSDGRALTLFDELVVSAHYSELIMEGVIVPCKVTGPDVVHTDKRPDPVKAYIKAGENKPAIFFCQDIEAANDVAHELLRRKVVAATFHSHMSKGMRRKAFEAFEQGRIQALCTVDAITEGVDLPNAHVGVLDQECHTLTPYLQAVGRILRSASDKSFAHLIDLRGASIRHGWPTIDRDYSLYGTGMKIKGGQETPERAPPEYSDVGRYDAKLVTWHDWKWPNADDKRRQLGWLRQQAASQGLGEEFAERAFAALFPEKEGHAEL